MSLLTRIKDTFLAIANDIKNLSGSNTIISSDLDANNIYRIVAEYTPGGVLYRRSVLSGGSGPEYPIRTETTYDSTGTIVITTKVFLLTYSGTGVVVSEVLQ